MLSHLPLFPLALLALTISALSLIPASDHLSLSNTSSHTTLTFPANIGVGMCPPSSTPATSRPLFKDCEYAINKKLPWLPASYNVFYVDGREGPFKLPVQTVYRSCNVTVTLCGDGVVRAWTGWGQIAKAATELNAVCMVKGKDEKGKDTVSGGEILTGGEGKVFVSLEKAKAKRRIFGAEE